MAKKGGEVKESAEEKELAQIAQEMSDDFDTRWKPLRAKAIADIKDIKPEKAQALGIAKTETGKAFAEAKDRSARTLAMAGAKPGSGRFFGGESKMSAAEGASTGGAANDAAQTVESGRRAGLLSLAGMGRGEKAKAIGGLEDVAGLARQRAYSDAERSLADSMALQQAVGTGAGIAAGSIYGKGKNPDTTAEDFAIGGIYGPDLSNP